MIKFEEYRDRFEFVKLERSDGILEMTLHTEGKELRWGLGPHEELPEVFYFVGQDRDTKVIIFTGTGTEFSGPAPSPDSPSFPTRPEAFAFDKLYSEGKALLMNMLNIEVPMIGAVNGPAMRHSELPLLCDIVLAAEEASFQDSGHFISNLMPGDGVHIVYPLLMGLNRGRYFLFTGQKLDAQKCLELGLVNEVMPRDKLMARARELAQQLAKYPPLHLRYTRVILTEYLKRQMQELLGYGLSLEGMALMERPLPPRD
jgi:enoyl-CoA hydratase/carnithine racemase